jgi:hypothetical protein
MSDRDNEGADRSEPASDLSEIATHVAALDLLDLTARLAAPADHLKALAATPMERMSEPDDLREI